MNYSYLFGGYFLVGHSVCTCLSNTAWWC